VSDEQETPAQVCAREGHEPSVPIYDYNVSPPRVVGQQCPRCGARQ
jgi:hypothetical protein